MKTTAKKATQKVLNKHVLKEELKNGNVVELVEFTDGSFGLAFLNKNLKKSDIDKSPTIHCRYNQKLKGVISEFKLSQEALIAVVVLVRKLHMQKEWEAMTKSFASKG